MRHYVLISGSANSFAAAILVAQRCREDKTVAPILIFADTLIEHQDTYRLVEDTVRSVRRICWFAGPTHLLVWLKSPLADHFDWSRGSGSCCRILKHDMIDQWLETHANREEALIHVGTTWQERCSFFGSASRKGLKDIKRAAGWQYNAPLCEIPYQSHQDIQDLLADFNVRDHVLAGSDMDHVNCGGFCYRNGTRQWHRYYQENRSACESMGYWLDSAEIVSLPGRRVSLEAFMATNPGHGLEYPRESFGCFSSCLEE